MLEKINLLFDFGDGLLSCDSYERLLLRVFGSDAAAEVSNPTNPHRSSPVLTNPHQILMQPRRTGARKMDWSCCRRTSTTRWWRSSRSCTA